MTTKDLRPGMRFDLPVKVTGFNTTVVELVEQALLDTVGGEKKRFDHSWNCKPVGGDGSTEVRVCCFFPGPLRVVIFVPQELVLE